MTMQAVLKRTQENALSERGREEGRGKGGREGGREEREGKLLYFYLQYYQMVQLHQFNILSFN